MEQSLAEVHPTEPIFGGQLNGPPCLGDGRFEPSRPPQRHRPEGVGPCACRVGWVDGDRRSEGVEGFLRAALEVERNSLPEKGPLVVWRLARRVAPERSHRGVDASPRYIDHDVCCQHGRDQADVQPWPRPPASGRRRHADHGRRQRHRHGQIHAVFHAQIVDRHQARSRCQKEEEQADREGREWPRPDQFHGQQRRRGQGGNAWCEDGWITGGTPAIIETLSHRQRGQPEIVQHDPRLIEGVVAHRPERRDKFTVV